MVWPNIDPPQEHQIVRSFRQPPAGEKEVELELLYLAVSDTYEVKSITNSTWLRPGIWITHDLATEINDHWPKWKVKSESYQLLAKIFGIFGGIHIP